MGKLNFKTNSEYATWQVIEEYLPRHVHEQYRKIFNSFDEEGTGVVNIENVAKVVSEYEITAEDIRTLLQDIVSGNQCTVTNQDFVDFPEFIAILSSISTVSLTTLFGGNFYLSNQYFRIVSLRKKYYKSLIFLIKMAMDL